MITVLLHIYCPAPPKLRSQALTVIGCIKPVLLAFFTAQMMENVRAATSGRGECTIPQLEPTDTIDASTCQSTPQKPWSPPYCFSQLFLLSLFVSQLLEYVAPAKRTSVWGRKSGTP